MHSRQEWTNRRPAFSAAHVGVPDIFIHHEGGGQRGNPIDKPAVLREIEMGVIAKGYIAIDYNVMVFQDGSVWAGRGVQNEDGATIHNNATSQSICAVGNFELERAPDALIAGIQQAIREVVGSGYTNSNPAIRAHQEVYSTACPGRNLIARMGEIKNWHGAPAPTPPAEDIGGELMHFIQIKSTTPKPVAGSNGMVKNIYRNGNEYATAVWCAAVQGSKNPNQIIQVSQEYWDSLPTVG